MPKTETQTRKDVQIWLGHLDSAILIEDVESFDHEHVALGGDPYIKYKTTDGSEATFRCRDITGFCHLNVEFEVTVDEPPTADDDDDKFHPPGGDE